MPQSDTSDLSIFDPVSLATRPDLLRVVVVLLLLGFVLSLWAWLRGRAERADAQARLADAGHDALRLTTRLEAEEARRAELEAERDSLTDALHAARQSEAVARESLATVESRNAAERKAAEAQMTQLRELRKEMTGQFRLLSDETLRRQGADLEKAHSDRLNALLTPLAQQVGRFQTELQTRNKAVDEERARLREQIEGLHKRSEAIGQEATALTRALRGEKQKQGAWGEMVLERLLEDSGLLSGTHYDTQSSLTDEAGKRWRPDVIVRMPQERALVIDAKVSLVAYERAVNAEDPDARKEALKAHVAALRAHITGLSARGYQRLDAGSVDFVLLFIPIEGALAEAMRFDPEIARFAVEQRVGLATPMTLMLTLRTVDHIWTVEKRESNAAEIADRAGKLYDKIVGVVDAMEDVGRAIDTAHNSHRQAMSRLSQGSGNVIRQTQMLRALGAKSSKKLELSHDKIDDA